MSRKKSTVKNAPGEPRGKRAVKNGRKKTKSEKKTEKTIQRARNNEKKSRMGTAQLIQYEGIADSGLAYLGDGRYSVTLELEDISYQLAPEETQQNIVESYARFLNGHLAGQDIQISVINRVLDADRVAADIRMDMRGDGYDMQRQDYNNLINHRVTSHGNTQTRKFITLTTKTESEDEARTMLSRLATEDQALLRSVGGCKARLLSGVERVNLVQSLLRPLAREFTYEDMVGSGLTTKEIIAPLVMDVKAKDRLAVTSEGTRVWKMMILRDLPVWMSDRLIKEITDIPLDCALSLHLKPIDQAEGLALVKRQIASMDIQRSNTQRKLAKQGLGEEHMSHELQHSYSEAVALRELMEKSNEKLFSATIIVGVCATTNDELDEAVERIRRVCGKHSCSLEDTRYMQIDAFNAILPLGVCRIPIARTITTAVGAVMVPFTTQELMVKGGMYYGLNALSKNVIAADRTKGMNSNAFILGTSGSGKSQHAKFEMMQLFLRRPHDEILIIDPEREYVPLSRELHANRVVISGGSTDCINPLALNTDIAWSEGDPIREKTSYVVTLCEVLLGGVNGLSSIKRSLIDRAAGAMYRDFLSGAYDNQPTLNDLREKLASYEESEAQEIAVELEMYTKEGSGAGFSGQTNIDRRNRITVYDISDLSSDLQTFGMMVVLDEVWSRIAYNKSRGVRTWLYIDEFHLLFANDKAAEYCQAIYKRVRKWGAAATGITQNIEELLANDRARLMLSNADGLFLLNQQSTDADALVDLLSLSAQQREYFTNTPPGNGLLRMGPSVIPFDNTMDRDSHIYKVFSTTFREVEAQIS
ncbi:VirB4-like conjugal transfer ATPase, CD1110 family [Actinotignum urinale]|uniref:ATP-binding protein n=2 Tax=Actinotignum urinale TaxID=190146 RepID=A0ABU5G8B8_9ACTO|nr:ATP-binding protein [Actinotignum urinale]MDY5133563.1 ATP-binding protein [Actinotignum urinale]